MKSKQPSSQVRANAESVAAAIGLDLYGKVVKRRAQLAAVSSLMKCSDFPKSKKGLLDRAALAAFVAVNVRLSEDCRSFELLPSAVVDADKLTPAEIAEQKKKRLDYFEDIYLNPGKRLAPSGQSYLRLLGREEDELREHRPHLFHKAADFADDAAANTVFPKHCNLSRLPFFYKARWPEHKIMVNKQRINHWQKGVGLPPAAPFHPVYDCAGRYVLSECFLWFEKWILPKYKMDHPASAESEPQLDIMELKEREEREQIEFNRWERDRERGEFVHKHVALATGIAAVRKLHVMIKTEDERNLPRLRCEAAKSMLAELAVPAETIGQFITRFAAFDLDLARSVTDKREAAMQASGAAEAKTTTTS